MRIVWTLVRIVLTLGALATLFVTPLSVAGPSGTSVDTNGALIDAVAVIVLLATLYAIWRDRRAPT